MQKDDVIYRQAAIDALRVAYWDDNIQSAKDDPCIVDAMTDWAIRQVKALPSAQPDTYEALRILDAIHSSGRLDYGDYCDLHDAISEIGGHKEDAVEPYKVGHWVSCPNCGAVMINEKGN